MDNEQITAPVQPEEVAQPPVPPAGGSYTHDPESGSFTLIERTKDRNESDAKE